MARRKQPDDQDCSPGRIIQPEIQDPFLVHNYPQILNIVDAAVELLAECLMAQLVTVTGKKKKNLSPLNLLTITKALMAINVMYRGTLTLLPPPPKKEETKERTYEEFIRQANSEDELKQ